MQKEMTLIEHYKKYFHTRNANTEELKQQAFELRYKVYHDKYGLDGEDHEAIKYDKYDDVALHNLLIHTSTNKAIGYTRLIPFASLQVTSLPIEKLCEQVFLPDIDIEKRLHNDHTGEVSRLCLHPDFRRRSPKAAKNAATQSTVDDFQGKNNRRYSENYMSVCMILASLNLMQVAKLEYAVALIERSLEIQLKRQGLVLEQIGAPIHLYGARMPFIIHTQASCDNIKPKYRQLFEVIAKEFANS